MPATVGDQWHFGIPEIGGILFFGGLFVFWVFNTLDQATITCPNEIHLLRKVDNFIINSIKS